MHQIRIKARGTIAASLATVLIASSIPIAASTTAAAVEVVTLVKSQHGIR